MPKVREDFKPDVGGFLDGVNGSIVDAEFAVASGEYADRVMAGDANAKPPVVLVLTVESPELQKPAVQQYSVGSQDLWDIASDGKSVKHIKSPEKRSFRSGSRATDLVTAMMTAWGNGSLEKGQEVAIARDHYMTEADFYTGNDFFWENQERSTVGGAKSNVPLPSKFNGSSSVKGTSPDKAEASDTSEMDKILIANAPGKTVKELKSFAVRHPEIRKVDAFMRAVVSGKKLTDLENSGKLTKDPTTDTYL